MLSKYKYSNKEDNHLTNLFCESRDQFHINCTWLLVYSDKEKQYHFTDTEHLKQSYTMKQTCFWWISVYLLKLKIKIW